MTRNQISYQNMLIEAQKATETQRTNRAKELETHRSNVVQEEERRRSNLANEAIGRTQAGAAIASSVGNMMKGIGSLLPW